MKKIIIVGGGIAGLSAGIFAQKNGFESIILEKNNTIGGECAGWNRGLYHIDACIHWLVGTKEGTAMFDLWENIGAFDNTEIFQANSFMAFENNNKTINFYRDLEKLRENLLEIAPEDKKIINEFSNSILKLQAFSMEATKPLDLMSSFEKIQSAIKFAKFIPLVIKYNKISILDLANKFQNPFIRESIASMSPIENFSALSLMFPLASFTSGQAGIPYGGSKAFAERIAQKYLKLGGKIHFSSEVTSLTIEEDKVESIKCINSKSFQGDYFIFALDPKILYEKLLKGKYDNIEYEKRYKDKVNYPLASNIYIGIAYEGLVHELPRSLKFPVKTELIKENGSNIKFLQMTHYSYEEEFAPKGHSVITIAINQFEPELQKWEELIKNRSAYEKEKNLIAKEVIVLMENRFSKMRGKLKCIEILTPQSYARHCNAYRGAFMGFWPTIKGKQLIHNGEIKGLKNIFLSGQWLQPPGGLPIALITGKDTIMRICKNEKIRFKLK